MLYSRIFADKVAIQYFFIFWYTSISNESNLKWYKGIRYTNLTFTVHIATPINFKED